MRSKLFLALIVVVFILGNSFGARASEHADVVGHCSTAVHREWLGPYDAIGLGVIEAEARQSALDAMEEFVDDMQDDLPAGSTVLGVAITNESYDGFEYVIEFIVLVEHGRTSTTRFSIHAGR